MYVYFSHTTEIHTLIFWKKVENQVLHTNVLNYVHTTRQILQHVGVNLEKLQRIFTKFYMVKCVIMS